MMAFPTVRVKTAFFTAKIQKSPRSFWDWPFSSSITAADHT
jgi:hypothetical protein